MLHPERNPIDTYLFNVHSRIVLPSKSRSSNGLYPVGINVKILKTLLLPSFDLLILVRINLPLFSTVVPAIILCFCPVLALLILIFYI